MQSEEIKLRIAEHKKINCHSKNVSNELKLMLIAKKLKEIKPVYCTIVFNHTLIDLQRLTKYLVRPMYSVALLPSSDTTVDFQWFL